MKLKDLLRLYKIKSTRKGARNKIMRITKTLRKDWEGGNYGKNKCRKKLSLVQI